MSIDKKKLFRAPITIMNPDDENGRRILELLNKPHPAFLTLPAIDKLVNFQLPLMENLLREEFERPAYEVLPIIIPPSLEEAVRKYNEGLRESARMLFKVLKPLSDTYSVSMRESFSIVVAKDEVKRLERLLQKHPQRHDVKLKILNLRREIKRHENETKGKKHVQKQS